MEIREGSAARDLGRVLRCFDERLKALEKTSNAGEAGSRAGAPSRNAAEFDAGKFSVTVRSAVRSQQAVRVLLNIRNKTTEDLFIGKGSTNGRHVISDETTGVIDDSPSITGLNYGGTNKDNNTLIPAGSMISMSVATRADWITGIDANLRLTLEVLENSRVRLVSIPLSFQIRN